MAASTARNLRTGVEDQIDRAKEQGEGMMNAVDHKARQLTDNAVEELSSLAANLNTRLKEFGIDTDRAVEGAKEGAASLERKISDELVNHPLRSLAIAAGVGLFLGMMSRK